MASPTNPLIFNGAYGYDNLTVQSTGHATMFETPEQDWYAVFLARRKINGSSPLGRETFMTTVEWRDDGWPVFNNGQPILLTQTFGPAADQEAIPPPFHDTFNGSSLDISWYQLRSPYTDNFNLTQPGEYPGQPSSVAGGLTFVPNVFGLSDRDTPAAILRKQKSLNMTVSAKLRSFTGALAWPQSIGLSVYLSELEHQDVGLQACMNATGMCLYSTLILNGTSTLKQVPINATDPGDITLHIRAEPLSYYLGYSITEASSGQSAITWLDEIDSSWLAFAPPGWFVFEGAAFALFASGNGNPWPYDAPEVGFTDYLEEYYEEDIPDYDRW